MSPKDQYPNPLGITLGADTSLSVVPAGEGVVVSFGSLTLLGSISVGAGASLYLGVGGFTNAGVIQGAGADTTITVADTITGVSLTNSGDIDITDGATLVLANGASGMTNTGTITIDATSTLNMGGTFSAAQLDSIRTAGGALVDSGTLINTGATLAIGPGENFGSLALDGKIEGGVVTPAAGSVSFHAAWLDNVTWDGVLDLSADSASASITGTFTLEPTGDGMAHVELTGALSELGFSGITLDHTMIDAGSVGSTVTLYGPIFPDGEPPLVLGASTTLSATVSGAGVVNLIGDVENQGLITDSTAPLLIGSEPYTGGGIFIGIPVSTTFDNEGTIVVNTAGGTTTVGLISGFSNAGLFEIQNGGTLLVQSSTFANTGSLQIDGGAILFTGTVTQVGTLSFSGSTDVLGLQGGAGFTAILVGWQAGNEIQLSGEGFTLGGTADTLEVRQNGSLFATLVAPVPYYDFALDSSGADAVIDTRVACYAKGTSIATARGDTPVDSLRKGDEIMLATGDTAPAVWIGHRRIDCTRHPRPRNVWPVRVRRDAFGEGLPSRDLLLSPDHAIFIYDVLIPIRLLINGVTVTQETVDEITYYHIELPAHGVILAENLPAESYLDFGNRSAFDNGGGELTLHPDFATRVWQENACAELIMGGPTLTAVRQRLALQAGLLRHAAQPRGSLSSHCASTG
jgi:collagen type I/II/III/V/XI/XXIV/XXVII alpha